MQELKELAKRSAIYKKLTERQFRRINGYADFKEVALILASSLVTKDAYFQAVLAGKSPLARTTNSLIHSAWLAHQEPLFPVFAINKKLGEAFQQTDLPPHVCGIQRIAKTALMLFPRGLVTSPDGFDVEWVFVTHFLKGEASEGGGFLPPGFKAAPPTTENKLRWVTMVGEKIIYDSVLELPEDSDRPNFGELFLELPEGEYNVGEQTEIQFSRSVSRIILQALLYLQTRPEELDTKPSSALRRKGFSSQSLPRELDPIWIGRNYQSRHCLPGSGTHASPRAHLRRGHWRRVAIGENRSDRKWVWIEPTLVNVVTEAQGSGS